MGFSLRKALGLKKPKIKVPEAVIPAPAIETPDLEAVEDLETEEQRAAKAVRSGKSSLRIPRKGTGQGNSGGGASSATGTNI